MKTRVSIVLIILGMLAALALGVAKPLNAQVGVVWGDAVVVTAELVAVDKVDRTLALLGFEGNVGSLKGRTKTCLPQRSINR